MYKKKYVKTCRNNAEISNINSKFNRFYQILSFYQNSTDIKHNFKTY